MKRLLLLLFIVLIFEPIHAQVQEALTPLELKQTTIVTQPATLNKGFLRAGFALSFAAVDKFFDDDAKKRLFPDNIWAKSLSYQFAFQYGVSDRLQASLSIPFRNEFISQSLLLEAPLSGTSEITSWGIEGNGLSDVELGLIYQLVPEDILRRAVLVSAFLTLPTGEKDPTDIVDEQNYTLPTGSGEGTLDLGVTFRKVQYPFSYEGAIAYDIKFGGTKIIDVGEDPTDFKSGNLLTLRGAYNFHLNEWLVFQNDIFYFSFGDDEVDGQANDLKRWALQYVPRLSFQIKRFRINQAVSFVVKGRNSSADPGYTMVVQYVF
ncbi:MAG: transporter [Bacteroidota bacterium]